MQSRLACPSLWQVIPVLLAQGAYSEALGQVPGNLGA